MNCLQGAVEARRYSSRPMATNSFDPSSRDCAPTAAQKASDCARHAKMVTSRTTLRCMTSSRSKYNSSGGSRPSKDS